MLYLSVILLAFGVVVCAIGFLGVLLNRGTATQVGEHTEESRPPVVLSITAIVGILCVIAGAWLLHIFAHQASPFGLISSRESKQMSRTA